MKRTKFLLILSVFYMNSLTAAAANDCFSPDEKIKVSVNESESGACSFSVFFEDDIIIQNSPLGIVLNKKGFNFGNGLKLINKSESVIDENYTMVVGKRVKRHNHCTESVYSFINAANESLDIVFRVFNDGVAFSYHLYNKEEASVVTELSSFNFISISNSWTIPYSSGDERFFEKNLLERNWKRVPYHSRF